MTLLAVGGYLMNTARILASGNLHQISVTLLGFFCLQALLKVNIFFWHLKIPITTDAIRFMT